MQLTKEGLERSVPFEVRDVTEATGDGLTLTGHAAVFNVKTEINSWEGSFLEEIAPGAFKKTIRERTPVMQFDHGRHPLIGSIPIGSIESLSEDDIGLAVEGRMTDNWLMQPIRDAIKEKTVKGMSFRFDVIREEWRDNTGKVLKDPEEIWRLMWNPGDRGPIERTLKELRVHELGPVVFPAYVETDVSVRAVAAEVYTDAKLRHALRMSLSLSLPDNYHANDKTNQIALAREILWGDRPLNGEHQIPLPVIVEPVRETTPVVEIPVKEDAPPIERHPSSPDKDLRVRMAYNLRSMQRTLNAIPED